MTSEFIPRTLYRLIVSVDGSLHGYVDFSLSKFNSSDMDYESLVHLSIREHRICRYPDYKKSYEDTEHKYENSLYFYHIWFARILFVVVFQNVVAGIVMALKIAIPDIPTQLKYKIGREAYIVNELVMSRMKKGEATGNENSKSTSSPAHPITGRNTGSY